MLGWAILSAALFIPAIGDAVIQSSRQGTHLALGLLAFPVLWVAGACLTGFLSHPARKLQMASAARALVPPLAAAALLAISTAPFHQVAAYRWFQRDDLMKVGPEHATFAFERKISLQLRKELRQTMGMDE